MGFQVDEAEVIRWAARLAAWSPRERLAWGMVGPYSKAGGRRLLEGADHVWRGVLVVDDRLRDLVESWLDPARDGSVWRLLEDRCFRLLRPWTRGQIFAEEPAGAPPIEPGQEPSVVCILLPADAANVLEVRALETSDRVVRLHGGHQRHHFARSYDAEVLHAVAFFGTRYDEGVAYLRRAGRRDLIVAVEERLSAATALLIDDLAGARDDLDHLDVVAAAVHGARALALRQPLDILHLLTVHASRAIRRDEEEVIPGLRDSVRWVAPHRVAAAFEGRGYARPMPQPMLGADDVPAGWRPRLKRSLEELRIDGLPLLDDQREFVYSIFDTYFHGC